MPENPAGVAALFGWLERFPRADQEAIRAQLHQVELSGSQLMMLLTCFAMFMDWLGLQGADAEPYRQSARALLDALLTTEATDHATAHGMPPAAAA